VAVAAERIAALRRGRFERGEAADGEAAERVYAAGDCRVAQAEVEQAPRREQCLRTRSARGRYRVGRATDPQQAGGERRGGADLLLLVGKPGREGTGLDPGRHRVLAGSDAGGAGADDDGDALRAVARERRIDRRADLRRCGGEQAVVATVVLLERRGERRELAHHAADARRRVGQPARFDAHARGVAGKKRAACRLQPFAERRDDAKGLHVAAHFLPARASGANSRAPAMVVARASPKWRNAGTPLKASSPKPSSVVQAESSTAIAVAPGRSMPSRRKIE